MAIILLIILIFNFSPDSVFAGVDSTGSRQEEPRLAYSAEITWHTDKPSTSQVEYTRDIAQGFGNITPLFVNLVTSHKVILSNLMPDVVYHYRIKSRDALGQESISKNYTLLISSSSVRVPIEISDVKAGNITAGGLSRSDAVYPLTRETLMAKALFQKEEEKSPPKASSLPVKEEPIEKTLIQKGGLLLQRNKLQIEPSFTYVHVSANRLAFDGITLPFLDVVLLGRLTSEKVKRDIFIAATSFRYGLFDNLQWNLKIPFRSQHDRVSNESLSTESTRSQSGIGDIETGIVYQLLYEQESLPGVIAGLNIKSDTGKHPYGRDIGLGTGHWAIKPNLVWVKSSDPAIIFGSLGFTWNIKRDISGFGEIEPGQSFDYSLGIAFALNYQTALNFQLEQQITDSLKINGVKVPASFTNASTFKSGFTYSLSKNLSLDVVTGYGLSEDAPDFTLELRLPYTF